MSSKIKYNTMISSLLSSTQRRSARMFATISAAVCGRDKSADVKFSLSGHAMTIAATIALAMYMTRHFKHRRPLWVALVVLGVLIALSRVVVGAHWPADVLVGSGLGILVALLAITWEQRSPWSPRLQTKPFQLVLLLVELGLVLYLFKAKTDTEAARLAFDLIATVGIAGAMNRWICLRREAS
jgi:membrane-associated PAP2 superfamily phosphatase